MTFTEQIIRLVFFLVLLVFAALFARAIKRGYQRGKLHISAQQQFLYVDKKQQPFRFWALVGVVILLIVFMAVIALKFIEAL